MTSSIESNNQLEINWDQTPDKAKFIELLKQKIVFVDPSDLVNEAKSTNQLANTPWSKQQDSEKINYRQTLIASVLATPQEYKYPQTYLDATQYQQRLGESKINTILEEYHNNESFKAIIGLWEKLSTSLTTDEWIDLWTKIHFSYRYHVNWMIHLTDSERQKTVASLDEKSWFSFW